MANGRLKATLRAATDRLRNRASDSAGDSIAAQYRRAGTAPARRAMHTRILRLSAFRVHGCAPSGGGTGALGRHPERTQRVLQHAVRQLALAHDHVVDLEPFELHQLALAVGA